MHTRKQQSYNAPPMSRMSVVSVVIPTYQERDTIGTMVREVAAVMGTSRFEIIVVDDNSPDGTADLAAGLAGALSSQGAPTGRQVGSGDRGTLWLRAGHRKYRRRPGCRLATPTGYCRHACPGRRAGTQYCHRLPLCSGRQRRRLTLVTPTHFQDRGPAGQDVDPGQGFRQRLLLRKAGDHREHAVRYERVQDPNSVSCILYPGRRPLFVRARGALSVRVQKTGASAFFTKPEMGSVRFRVHKMRRRPWPSAARVRPASVPAHTPRSTRTPAMTGRRVAWPGLSSPPALTRRTPTKRTTLRLRGGRRTPLVAYAPSLSWALPREQASWMSGRLFAIFRCCVDCIGGLDEQINRLATAVDEPGIERIEEAWPVLLKRLGHRL